MNHSTNHTQWDAGSRKLFCTMLEKHSSRKVPMAPSGMSKRYFNLYMCSACGNVAERGHGIISKIYPTGFGFIKVSQPPDIFFHIDRCPRRVREGDILEFTILQGPKGLMAGDICVH